jgi:hypothetical protein
MESAKETAVCGQVTGQFADALNWSSEAMNMFAGYMNEDVKTAEDAFNVALSECSTEQERQALITETLTALYGDSAEKYRETAQAQMEAKEATADNMLAQNNLATALEPVTTSWQELKNEMLVGILPVIEKINPLMQDALNWMKEHPVAMKVMAAVLGTLAIAFSGLAIALGIYAIAQWAANSAMAPFIAPILLIVAAIAAVVAIIVLCVEYWDVIVEAVKNAIDKIKEFLITIGEWINTNVIQPVIGFFKSLWEGIKSVWDGICNVIQVAFMFIGSIISAAFQIITLPFRFIWENCKEYVFSAFEWIKEKIGIAIDFIKNLVQVGFDWIKDHIITPIRNARDQAVETFDLMKMEASEKITAMKEKVTEIFNKVKSAIMNPINDAKAKVSSAIDAMKSAVSSKIDSIKSKVSAVFNNIRDDMQKPIEKAKNKIKEMIDAIKGFFSNLKLKLPNIKLPHFSIKGKFSLDPPSVPKLSITWNKLGAIFTRPTIFNTPLGLQGVGEAGPEAVLPIDRLEGYVENAIERTQRVINFDPLADAIERLADRAIELRINDRVIAETTASATDNVQGLRNAFISRGLVLE